MEISQVDQVFKIILSKISTDEASKKIKEALKAVKGLKPYEQFTKLDLDTKINYLNTVKNNIPKITASNSSSESILDDQIMKQVVDVELKKLCYEKLISLMKEPKTKKRKGQYHPHYKQLVPKQKPSGTDSPNKKRKSLIEGYLENLDINRCQMWILIFALNDVMKSLTTS